MANMFGTRQNNDTENRKSVITRVYQFKNKEGFEASALQVSGWDDMFSLRINPALPPEKRTAEQLYDYDKSVTTALNAEKVMLLLYKINKDIIPAIEKGEEKNIGINVGGDSLITIGTGKSITNSIRPYIAIFKNLNPDTKKPETSIYYEFKRNMTIDDYDPKTGAYSTKEGYHSEFNLFCELLKSFIQNSSFNAHNNRYNNRFNNDRIHNTLNSIASKVEADVDAPRYNNGGYNRRNVFEPNSGRNNNYSKIDTTMEELGDLNDLNELMNN